MELLRTYLFDGGYPFALLMAAVLYILPLQHRSHFGRRLGIGTIVAFWYGFGITACFFSLKQTARMNYFFDAALIGALFCAVVLLLYFCCEISWWDALYGATCAYATQNLLYSLGEIVQTLPQSENWRRIMFWVLMLLIYSICYMLFAKRLPDRGRYNVDGRSTILTLVLGWSVAFGLSSFASNVLESSGDTVFYRLTRVYGALCCFFILWLMMALRRHFKLQMEFETQKLLWHQREEQMRLSQETISIINHKCHDLKRQVAALRYIQDKTVRDKSLQEIENAVMIYDNIEETGSPILDALLSEKSLICEKEQINWSCMADGTALNFLDAVDLYCLIGNALDNAIEHIRQIQNPERRVLSVTVRTKGELVLIQIENYYDGEIMMQNGLPVTTKADKRYHGFGLSSMKATVEKYGGSFSIDTNDHVFLLSLMIPLPA